MGMQLIKVLDSDNVNRPVFAVREVSQPLTKEQLVKYFPKVFADGVGSKRGSCAARAKTSAGDAAIEAAEYTGRSGSTGCADSCD